MRVEELERELRAERQGPDAEFARRLDEWAAAGFPRDRGLGPRALAGRDRRSDRARRLWERISSVPPRRVLMPVGAVATVVVVGGVLIGQLERIGGSGDDAAESGSAALESSSGERALGAEQAPSGGDAGRTADQGAASAAPRRNSSTTPPAPSMSTASRRSPRSATAAEAAGSPAAPTSGSSTRPPG